jgi:parallel beta-helix repeat protein
VRGLSIFGTDGCVLSGNTISECGVAAIESYNQSKTTVNGNPVVAAGRHAFMTFTDGTIADHEPTGWSANPG